MTSADLRLGRWQDVLDDVECDAEARVEQLERQLAAMEQ